MANSVDDDARNGRRMRKRSPKVVWFPPDPTFGAAGGSLVYQRFAHDIIGSHAVSDRVTSFLPLTIDEPQIDASIISLADVESSGYRLRRIVGKVFCSVVQSSITDDSDGVICTCGFIVLRVDGSGNPTRTAVEADPALAGNADDPWIWRRSWILANGSSSGADPATVSEFGASSPFANYEGGPSAVDGPHVDQKTARIVSQDERLFGVFTTTLLHAVDTAVLTVNWVTDLRLLASMRTSQGNRRNASR